MLNLIAVSQTAPPTPRLDARREESIVRPTVPSPSKALGGGLGRDHMTRILAIETSCDETAAAVVENGRHLLSNVVATQIELHSRFGGVFPEVASRQHILAIQPVIQQAIREAGVAHVRALDAIAVTHGPGLAGSLLVGVNAAKGLAFASGLPLLAINHLEGHIYSNWIEAPGRPAIPEAAFPAIILIVSGGHTELVLMTGHGQYRQLGATLDDAAGEAFDKVARRLELGFPGGPAIQQAAQTGHADRFVLPRPLLQNDAHRFNFSFSGLKTAVLNLVRQLERKGENIHEPQLVADIAAAFQSAVADVLVHKTADAAAAFGVRQVCICGGVSANALLRATAQARFAQMQLPLYIPPLFLCTDNAAMIGAAAFYRWQQNTNRPSDLSIDVVANLRLPEIQVA
jgi:N6-L-threonylcarbamoyladenine synthase